MKDFIDNVESGAGNALGAVLMLALLGIVFGFVFKPRLPVAQAQARTGCGCQG